MMRPPLQPILCPISCELSDFRYVATAQGRQVELPYLPAQILRFFIDHPNVRHRTDTLIEAIYGDRECGLLDPKNNLKVNIFNLRRHLRDGGIALALHSRPWKGYRFTGASLIEDWRPLKRRPGKMGVNRIRPAEVSHA
jgi:DNA-binding winged helix-turn-helix (wHTH) protein